MGMGPINQGGDGSYRPQSEINITPLVDVMLVLLIIFMVAAPLMSVGVSVELPKTEAAKLTPPKDPIVVSLDKDGQIFIREDMVSEADLPGRLKAMADEQPDTVVYVRGDRGIDYGQVMDLMGRVGQAGFSKVSLMAEMPAGGGKP